MRAVSRPAVYIGFSYFGALLLATFLGESVTPYIAAALLLSVPLCFIFRMHRRHPARMLVLCAAAAGMTVFSVLMLLTVRPAERYLGNTYRIRAVIESEAEAYSGNFRYTARVRSIKDTGQSVDFSVRLSHGEALPAEIGDTVECTVRFVPFLDDGGLSSRAAQLADGKLFAAYITDYEQIAVTPAAQKPPAYYSAAVRAQVRDSLLRALPKDEAAVLTAMLVGLRNDISDPLNSAYRTAGASHILVISGMHMAIIAQFALGALSLLGVRRKYAAGISIAFILAFMAVSGLSATVVRSGIMQIILLTGILIGRKADALNSLGVAILFLALVNPFCVGDVSLLLSFSATLGILALNPRMMRALTGRVRNVRRRMRLQRILPPAVTSVCAILGAMPVQLYVFGSVSFSAVLTSILVLYASAWLLRFGLLAAACLNIPFLAPAAAPFVFLSGLLAKYQNAVVRWMADAFPNAFCISGPYAAPTVLLCTVFLLCGLRLFRGRHTAVLYTLAAGVLAFGMAANWYLNGRGTRLLIYHTPLAACTARIDGDTASVFGCSGNAAAVGEALRNSGASRIDLLHVQPDESAVRCAEALAEEFPVSSVLYPDTVYFPTDAQRLPYAYGADGMLADGSTYSVTGGGDLVRFSAAGRTIALESGDGGFSTEAADILITDDAESMLRGALTVLQTEDARLNAETLPAGCYLLSGEHERICLRFGADGSYTIYGG